MQAKLEVAPTDHALIILAIMNLDILYNVLQCLCRLCTVHLSSSRVPEGEGEKETYQERRKPLLCSFGSTAVKCFTPCSPTLIDTYIRPPVLPQ